MNAVDEKEKDYDLASEVNCPVSGTKRRRRESSFCVSLFLVAEVFYFCRKCEQNRNEL